MTDIHHIHTADCQHGEHEEGIEFINLIDHVLAEHYLTILRDKNANTQAFTTALHRLSEIIAMELMYGFENYTEIEVETPITKTEGIYFQSEQIVLLPILRAGLGMLDGFRRYLPEAQISFVAQQRDEQTFEPISSYEKIPNLTDKKVFILDIMLATAGSAIATMDRVMALGAKPEDVYLISIISTPEGIEKVYSKHPEINFFTVNVDECLNEHKFIVPGLGDAGDRLFNTVKTD